MMVVFWRAQNLPAHGKRRPLPVEISQAQLTNKKQEKKLLSQKPATSYP
jgi:hypothetical protein